MEKQKSHWVRQETIGRTSVVTLAAPDGPNRINAESARDLYGAVAAADAERDTRVIVIRTDAPAWNVGGDLSVMRGGGPGVAAIIEEIGRWVNPLALLLHTSPKVTIASVRGAVAGGATGVMAACDLVIAADDATITQGYAKLATSPDVGVTWFLARQLGYRKAFELYLTSERMDSATAERLGMVSRVVPLADLDSATSQLAEQIALLSPRATAQAKRMFRSGFDTPLDVQLDTEIRAFAANTLHPDFAEGVDAFFSRRNPVFG